MDERQKLFIAQDWVRKLANGINPLNGNAVKEDDIVNDVHVSRCLFYVADILGKCSERKTIAYILRNNAFDPAAVQRDRYHYVDAISIAPFAQEIEKLIPEDMEAWHDEKTARRPALHLPVPLSQPLCEEQERRGAPKLRHDSRRLGKRGSENSGLSGLQPEILVLLPVVLPQPPPFHRRHPLFIGRQGERL